MSKLIKGVPESLTRDQFTQIIESFGFDPFKITELRLDATGVHATVFDLKEDGTKHILKDGSGVATSEVHIPLIDPEGA